MTHQEKQEKLKRLKSEFNDTIPGTPEEAELLAQIEKLKAEPVEVPEQTIPPHKISQFDIFLSYYNQDRPQVGKVALWLRHQDIIVWFDSWTLIPGQRWQEAMEQGLQRSHCIAAFLSPSGGFGNWGDMEMRTAVRLGVKTAKPIFMVMLPGCPPDPEIPLFIEEFTWVDLRSGLQDQENLERLRDAIIYHRENAAKTDKIAA